jgi:hypothetical protein
MAAIQKEKIKTQMVKTAARLWEIPEHEIEANFDPLVSLIFEACAAELENVGIKIRQSHERILEKLAEIMLPDAFMGGIPASGIITASPNELFEKIKPGHRFIIDQTVSPQINPGLYELIPLGSFPLLDISLEYIFYADKLLKLKENGSRSTEYNGENGNDTDTWILILKHNPKLEQLDGLQLFWNQKNAGNHNQLNYLLSNCSCILNNKEKIIFKNDYFFNDENEGDLFISNLNYTEKIIRKLREQYRNNFLSIVQTKIPVEPTFPEILENSLPVELKNSLKNEGYVFLTVKFPQVHSIEFWDSISCHVNAFPVVNLIKNVFEYKTNEWLNVIPLPVKGAFVDLLSVIGNNNKSYHFKFSGTKHQPDEGEVILKNKGIGNTTSVEVKEMVNQLIETIRDQYSFFSQVNNQALSNQFKEVNTALNKFEDRIRESLNLVDNKVFLVLKPFESGERVFIEYYSTMGPDLHKIKLYSPIKSLGHTTTKVFSAYNITAFLGGKSIPGNKEKELILKQQLFSRGKIITAEDIKIACQLFFNEKFDNIKIQRSLDYSVEKYEGYKPFISISIGLKKEPPLSQEELVFLLKQFEYHLTENSIPGINYKVNLLQ